MAVADTLAPKTPILSRSAEQLPETLNLGTDLPEDFDPLAEGILMDHQKTWLEDTSDLKIAEKGRRTGITFAEALGDTIIAASKKSAGGDNVFYIGDTKEKGREFIGYVAHFAKAVAGELVEVEEYLFEDKQADGTTKHISAYRARFASGYRVEALSSNPANIRGLQGIVVIDEAAFHKDVREVIDAVNAMLIWGGKVRIISTHNGVLNPFNELIREARAGKTPYKVHHIPFGDAVKNGLYRRVCLMQGKDWSQEAEDAWEAQIRGAYGSRTAAMRQELDAIAAEAEGAPGNTVSETVLQLRDKLEALNERPSSDLIQSWITGGPFETWLKDPRGNFPLVRLRQEDAKAIGSQRLVADVSPQTAAKQLREHPELTAADYAQAQATVSEATRRIQDGAQNLIFIREIPGGGHVLIVKATQTGQGLFITSYRRLSREAAKRDRELLRLEKKGR